MYYLSVNAPDSLSHIVKNYWMLEGKASESDPYTHRVMAGGMSELVFHDQGRFSEVFRNGKIEKSFISGIDAQSSRYKNFKVDEHFSMFAIHFYPYALPYLFSIPSLEVTDQLLDIQTLLGHEGVLLEEQIMNVDGFHDRISIMNQFLLGKLEKSPSRPAGVFEMIQQVIQTHGTIDIDSLAAQHFLSIRQFQRKFKEYAGFSPKLFSRIIRFQHAINNKQHTSLSQLALASGYADQSHFIRDFKEFSGYTPKEYFLKEPIF